MATAGNLVVNILGQSLKLQQELDKARSGVSRFVSFAKSALAGLAASFTFGKVMEEGFALETLETKLRVLLGSQQKAVNLMEELRQAAAKTPIGFHQTAEAAQFLLASGTKLHELTSEMKMLGDIASVSGGDLHMVANAYTQVRSAGKLQGQEMLQFINQNIPMIELLADHLGVAKNEIRGMMREGNISFEAVRGALMQATQEGGRFAGAMDELSKTGRGALTNLISNTRVAAGEIGRYLQELLQVNSVLRDVAKALAWVGEHAAFVTKLALSLATAYLITSKATKILAAATTILAGVVSGGLIPILQKLSQLLFATLAVFGILSTAESLLADETSEVAREIEQANGALDKHVDAQDRAGEAASATADKVSKEVERFRELIAAIEEVNNFNPRGAGAMDMAEFRHQLEKNILDIDMFLAEMLVKHRPVNPDLAMLQELVAKQGPKLTDDQFNLIDSLTDIVAGDETAKQRASLTREIELAERRIGYLIRDTSEEVQKVNDLSDGSVKNLDLQRELLMRLNREQEMLNEKKRQQQSLDEFNKFQLEEVQRIQRAFAEANDLLKTPADNILDKLIEFQAAGVGGELFQDAAIKLAENTGLFDPKDKEIVNQQALTAVSGMDAIAAVNQFNRDMERQKAEAEKQAKRDEKASKERERIIKALEGVGVNTKPLKDLKLAGAVP